MKTPEELTEDIFGFKLAQEKYIIAEAIRQRDAEVLKAIEEIYYNIDWEATELQQPELWIMQLKQKLGL